LKNGCFYTGDIGHIYKDGYLCITDRKKDLIKTAGGKYIAPQKIESLAKDFKVLSQVVVYGDQKPFASALLTLSQEYVMEFAQSHRIITSDYSELVKHPEVQKLVATAVEQLNAKLAKWETIKKYIVLPAEFTVESGDLTPSLKVKRKQVSAKYKDQLEALYKDKE
jgi:long-chain acyl-CoA synthetase